MDFLSLPLNKRADILRGEGKLLTTVSYYAHRINLYSFKGQFFELWRDVFTNKIEKIIAISKPRLFPLYVGKPHG
jgi:hypothetical protein